MSKFSLSTPRNNQQIKFMPVFHTCDGVDARRHLEARALITDDICEVFNEKVSYFFYGRAAYKYQVKDTSTRRLDLFPICFVFDLEVISDQISRIYPFDTGAQYHGMMEDFIKKKIPLIDFELEPETGRISDVVLRFFGDNRSYLNGQTKDVAIDPLDFESVAYRDMIKTPASHDVDERRVTIEVQCEQKVEFGGHALKGIIAPSQYLESGKFSEMVEGLGVKVRYYNIHVWNPKLNFRNMVATASEFSYEALQEEND